MISKKNKFSKSTILKKKLILKRTILKKNCTQKITLCLILPRKMRKFCVLRAYIKSTILKKKLILESTFSKKKFFLKCMILNAIIFVKSVIWNKIFSCCQILNNNFFVVSDFESTFFTTSQILNNLPKSTTCTFHIVFLHITMYSYSLQYLRQLDNSIRLRSYNTFCTRFRKDLHF